LKKFNIFTVSKKRYFWNWLWKRI